MASTKKSPEQKISASVANLLKTSKQRAEVRQGLEIVAKMQIVTVAENGEEIRTSGNAELERMLRNAKLRYDADVEYLRKNIIYNCGKVSETMGDGEFDEFAKGILGILGLAR